MRWLALGAAVTGLALLVTACGVAAAPTDTIYALNAQGDLRCYVIVEYGADGAPRGPAPLASPVTAGATHLAWPSYILDQGERRLLVFMFRDGRWDALGLWQEGGDGMLAFEGAVFEAGEDEPYGIGPGHVGYLPGVGEAIWNNPGGDTAILYNSPGEAVATYWYKS